MKTCHSSKVPRWPSPATTDRVGEGLRFITAENMQTSIFHKEIFPNRTKSSKLDYQNSCFFKKHA